MKLKNTVVMGLMLSAIAQACTTPGPSAGLNSRLSLDAADKIVIGQTEANDVESQFGTATTKLSPKGRNTETWIYCDPAPCSDGRLTVDINQMNHRVEAVTWTLRKEDGHRSPSKIAKRYPAAHFTKKRYIYNFGDYIDRVVVWADPKVGITLSTENDGAAVRRISRRLPGETQKESKKGRFPIVTEEPDSAGEG